MSHCVWAHRGPGRGRGRTPPHPRPTLSAARQPAQPPPRPAHPAPRSAPVWESCLNRTLAVQGSCDLETVWDAPLATVYHDHHRWVLGAWYTLGAGHCQRHAANAGCWAPGLAPL